LTGQFSGGLRYWGEPMGAPAIFKKRIEIKLLPPASTLKSRIQAGVTDSGYLFAIAFMYKSSYFGLSMGDGALQKKS
jgi:hypothetical protein